VSVVTLKFLIFIAATLAIYYICGQKYRWIIILVANICFFLASSTLALFAVFVTMTLLTWLAALLIAKLRSETTRNWIAAVTIAALVSVLIAYKELPFFSVLLNLSGKVFGSKLHIDLPAWAAPLGISYYTLILIGYLTNVLWENILEPQTNPLKMLAFSGFFPHMVSGPFSRYSDLAEPLFLGSRFQGKNLLSGAVRALWGVFKVLLVSSRLSVLVAAIFDAQQLSPAANPYVGIFVILGAGLYVMNVYMNFSGSMDIVIGVSEMFGIPLAENFNHPFVSTSLSEFWRRWHMSLGFWLKDYVLYPVLKSRWMYRIRESLLRRFGKTASKAIPTYIGMFITWFLVGFWHGGTLNYLFGSGLFFSL